MASRKSGPSSSARPAANLITPANAAQPASTANEDLRLGFYNLGWNATDKKHTVSQLAAEISHMQSHHNLHALGLPEIFGAGDGLNLERNICGQLLEKLNSAGQPVTWYGCAPFESQARGFVHGHRTVYGIPKLQMDEVICMTTDSVE